MLKLLPLLSLAVLSLPAHAEDVLYRVIEQARNNPRILAEMNFSVEDLNSLLAHGRENGRVSIVAVKAQPRFDRSERFGAPLLVEGDRREGLRGRQLGCLLEQLAAVRDLDWRAVGDGSQDLSSVEIKLSLNVLNRDVPYYEPASTNVYLDQVSGRLERIEIYNSLGYGGRGSCSVARSHDVVSAASAELQKRADRLAKEERTRRRWQQREDDRLGVARELYGVTNAR